MTIGAGSQPIKANSKIPNTAHISSILHALTGTEENIIRANSSNPYLKDPIFSFNPPYYECALDSIDERELKALYLNTTKYINANHTELKRVAEFLTGTPPVESCTILDFNVFNTPSNLDLKQFELVENTSFSFISEENHISREKQDYPWSKWEKDLKNSVHHSYFTQNIYPNPAITGNAPPEVFICLGKIIGQRRADYTFFNYYKSSYQHWKTTSQKTTIFKSTFPDTPIFKSTFPDTAPTNQIQLYFSRGNRPIFICKDIPMAILEPLDTSQDFNFDPNQLNQARAEIEKFLKDVRNRYPNAQLLITTSLNFQIGSLWKDYWKAPVLYHYDTKTGQYIKLDFCFGKTKKQKN